MMPTTTDGPTNARAKRYENSPRARPDRGQSSHVSSETQDKSGQAPEAKESICKASKERVIYIIPLFWRLVEHATAPAEPVQPEYSPCSRYPYAESAPAPATAQPITGAMIVELMDEHETNY